MSSELLDVKTGLTLGQPTNFCASFESMVRSMVSSASNLKNRNTEQPGPIVCISNSRSGSSGFASLKCSGRFNKILVCDLHIVNRLSKLGTNSLELNSPSWMESFSWSCSQIPYDPSRDECTPQCWITVEQSASFRIP